jgi:hypothetical protein
LFELEKFFSKISNIDLPDDQSAHIIQLLKDQFVLSDFKCLKNTNNSVNSKKGDQNGAGGNGATFIVAQTYSNSQTIERILKISEYLKEDRKILKKKKKCCSDGTTRTLSNTMPSDSPLFILGKLWSMAN